MFSQLKSKSIRQYFQFKFKESIEFQGHLTVTQVKAVINQTKKIYTVVVGKDIDS